MIEEIELILYKLEQNYKCDKEQYFVLYKPDIKQILDYITNLKQLYENALKVNQNTEKYRTELESKYVLLQQENEKLKLDVKYWENKWQNTRFANNQVKVLQDTIIKSANNTNKAMEQTEIYKSRCKKANEYVNKMWLAKLTPDIVSKTKGDLQNILNGSDEK